MLFKKNQIKNKLTNFTVNFTTLTKEINSTKKLKQFYKYLSQKKEVLVEESDDKKPIASKEKRSLLENWSSISKFFKFKPHNLLRVSLPKESGLVVMDFDLKHESYYNDTKTFKEARERLIELGKYLDLTIVGSPSGGMHLYCTGAEVLEFSNKIGVMLPCGYTQVDVLFHGISAPSKYKRPIINISSTWIKDDKIETVFPNIFYPLIIKGKKSEKEKILETFKRSKGHLFVQGCRLHNLKSVWSWCQKLNIEDLLLINKYFVYPPLPEREVKAIKKPQAAIKTKFLKALLSIETFDLIYDHSKMKYFNLDKQSGMWKKIEFSDWFQKNAEEASLWIGDKTPSYLESLIKTNCGVQNMDNEKIVFECNEFKNCFPYYTEQGIFFENKEGRIEKFSRDILKKYKISYQVLIMYESLKKLLKTPKYENIDSFLNKINVNCNKLCDWLDSLFDKFPEKLQKKLSETLILFFAVTFFKGYKDYGSKIILSKVFIFFGPGGTGKSTLNRLVSSLLPEGTTSSLEFEHLSNRFETSALVGKKLISFNDSLLEELSSTTGLRKLSILNRWSGGKDKIRIEEKYGKVFDFTLDALITVNTNSIFATPPIQLYGAIKRRYISFPFVTFRENPIEDFEKELYSDIEKLKIIFSKNEKLIPEICKGITDFDLENNILKYSVYKYYEKFVDSFIAFSHHVLIKSNGSEIRLNVFHSAYILYLYYREGSTMELNLSELLKQVQKSFKDPEFWVGEGGLIKESSVDIPGFNKIYEGKSRAPFLMSIIESRSPFVSIFRDCEFIRKNVNYSKIDNDGVTTEIIGSFNHVCGMAIDTQFMKNIGIPDWIIAFYCKGTLP